MSKRPSVRYRKLGRKLLVAWFKQRGINLGSPNNRDLVKAYVEHSQADPELVSMRATKTVLAYIGQRGAVFSEGNSVQKRPKVPRARKARKEKNTAADFYNSEDWRRLRYRALVRYGRKCMVCSATPEDGKKMHVDHIKPRSKFPHLELVLSNLQVLCEDCNLGKSNFDQIDWRPQERDLDLQALAELREKGLLN